MYYLVHISEIGSMGGHDKDVEIIKRSKMQDKLLIEIKKILHNALEDENVEFINGYEKERFDIDAFDDVDGSVEIMRRVEGACLYDNDYYQITWR